MALPATDAIEQLRSQFRGRVIGPDDDGYDEARTPFYGGIDRHPVLVARAADATDVSNVIRLAATPAWSSPCAVAATASRLTASPTASCWTCPR